MASKTAKVAGGAAAAVLVAFAASMLLREQEKKEQPMPGEQHTIIPPATVRGFGPYEEFAQTVARYGFTIERDSQDLNAIIIDGVHFLISPTTKASDSHIVLFGLGGDAIPVPKRAPVSGGEYEQSIRRALSESVERGRAVDALILAGLDIRVVEGGRRHLVDGAPFKLMRNGVWAGPGDMTFRTVGEQPDVDDAVRGISETARAYRQAVEYLSELNISVSTEYNSHPSQILLGSRASPGTNRHPIPFRMTPFLDGVVGPTKQTILFVPLKPSDASRRFSPTPLEDPVQRMYTNLQDEISYGCIEAIVKTLGYRAKPIRNNPHRINVDGVVFDLVDYFSNLRSPRGVKVPIDGSPKMRLDLDDEISLEKEKDKAPQRTPPERMSPSDVQEILRRRIMGPGKQHLSRDKI